MFLFPLNFPFNPCTGSAPLLEGKAHFLIAPLICNLLVLAEKPHLLDGLFFHVICWIVVVVVRPAFEPILIAEDNCLVIICVELREWERVRNTLFFFED